MRAAPAANAAHGDQRRHAGERSNRERFARRLIERINNLRGTQPGLKATARWSPGHGAELRDYIGRVAAGAELVVDVRCASDDLTFGLPEGDASLGGFFIGPTLFDMSLPTCRSTPTNLRAGVVHGSRPRLRRRRCGCRQTNTASRVAIFTRIGDAARDIRLPGAAGIIRRQRADPGAGGLLRFGGWKRSGFGDLNQHGRRQSVPGQDRHVAMAVSRASGQCHIIPTMS